MKTVTALEVRRHFGQLLDQASAGERIIIERAGQARAALVPLEDLRYSDPDERLRRQRAALHEIGRMARLRPAPSTFDAAANIRDVRDGRARRIAPDASKSSEKGG